MPLRDLQSLPARRPGDFEALPSTPPIRIDPPIFTKLVNSCWFCFKWTLALLFVTALVAGGYLYLRLDDEIRRYAETLIASHYDEHVVRLGSARFETGRGVVFHNLSIF